MTVPASEVKNKKRPLLSKMVSEGVILRRWKLLSTALRNAAFTG